MMVSVRMLSISSATHIFTGNGLNHIIWWCAEQLGDDRELVDVYIPSDEYKGGCIANVATYGPCLGKEAFLPAFPQRYNPYSRYRLQIEFISTGISLFPHETHQRHRTFAKST